MGYEVSDFQKQVIERSRQVPVVVDFWAAWCGPCMMFGPVIEKAAAEANGAWELVKVDTEANRDLAAQYQIQSLPTVRVFKDGQVVAEKLGAMPEPAFKEWISEFAISPGSEAVEEIEQLLFSGSIDRAIAKLKEDSGIDTNAELRLRAIAALAGSPEDVSGIVKEIPLSASEHSDGGYLEMLAKLRIKGGEGAYGEGLDALASMDINRAAEKWIEALTLNDANAGARKALKNLFLLLGPKHQVTSTWKPAFMRLS